MEFESRILSRFSYRAAEWKLIKLITGIYWLWVIIRIAIINNYSGSPYPEGISRLYDFSSLLQSPVSYILVAIATVLLVFYMLEKHMVPVLIALSIVSLAVLSTERSHGVKNRDELCSLLFLAQAIAYIRYSIANADFKSRHHAHSIAIFYSIQFIAAAYTMAGLSKLHAAGWHWVADSQNIITTLYKISGQLRIELGIAEGSTHIPWAIGFIAQHPYITRVMFFCALLIELFPFIALISRKHARVYGWLLLLLHAGIAAFTIILIPTFVLFVAIYMVGLPAKLVKLFEPKQTAQI